MCKDCVTSPYPDRGTTCYDSGSYMLNFKGCKACQEKNPLEAIDKTEYVDEEEEAIDYSHVCKICKHVVAKHKYSFKVTEEYQEYEMSCLLCGVGEDTRSILPNDPRKAGNDLW